MNKLWTFVPLWLLTMLLLCCSPQMVYAQQEDLAHLINELAEKYPECFEDAPEFNSVDEVWTFVKENCAKDDDGDKPDDQDDDKPDEDDWWIIDSLTVEQLIEWLSEKSPECFEDAPEFATTDEVWTFFKENCAKDWGDAWDDDSGWQDGWDWDWNSDWDWNGDWWTVDSLTVDQLVEWLSEINPDCFGDAPAFANLEEVWAFFDENCGLDWDWNNDWWGDDSLTVDQLVEWLSADYPDCFGDAPAFATEDEVWIYFDENCGDWGDDWWGDDSLTVDRLVEWLSADYPDCFGDPPAFATENEVWIYFDENCRDWSNDWSNDWNGDWWGDNSLTVDQLVEWLSEINPDCFATAPEFADLEAVFTFFNENCGHDWDWNWNEDWNGDWWSDDSLTVDQLINRLSERHPDCFEEGLTFETVDEVWAYFEENCGRGDDHNDENWWTGLGVEELVTVLAERHPECFEGDLSFETTAEVWAYFRENCERGGHDGEENESVLIEATVTHLSEQFPDCFESGEAFESLAAVYEALGDCVEEQWENPFACLTAAPEFTTLQSFLNFAADNCSDLIGDLPSCYFDAPIFEADEEYISWVFENCTDGGMGLVANPMVATYFADQSSNELTNVATTTANFALQLYPNPVEHTLFVELTTVESVQVNVYNATGQFINRYTTSGTLAIPTSDYVSGMYIVQIVAANGEQMSQQFIVK